MTIIKAQVPMSEMLTYEQHLTSATGAAAPTTWSTRTTTRVPAHLQTKIIARRRRSARASRSKRCDGRRALNVGCMARSVVSRRLRIEGMRYPRVSLRVSRNRRGREIAEKIFSARSSGLRG